MRIIKKNTKFEFDELYMCKTNYKEASQYGGFYYSSNFADVLIQDEDELIEVIGYDDEGNARVKHFSINQILSTRHNEESSIDHDDISKYIMEISEKEEYKDREYFYITDIQRFDKFLQQFGIDIRELKKITIKEARDACRYYFMEARKQIVRKYLSVQKDKIFASSLGFDERIINEVIKSIQEGTFEVTPEMLGLKKKNFLKRLFENRRYKNILDCPKKDITEGAGLKQTKPVEDGSFVPRIEISTQLQIPAMPEDTITIDEKEVSEQTDIEQEKD